MAGLQLSGLASGLDWKGLVDTLMQLERTPATRLEAEKVTNTTRLNALSTLGTRLTELRTAAAALNTAGTFNSRTASLGAAASGWSANAASGAALGTYSFKVSKLATAAKLSGAGDIGSGIAPSSDVSGVTLSTLGTSTAVTAGVFTVNGAQVTVDLTDSLQDLFDKVATATGNTVTASYNATTDRIELAGTGPITLGAANDTSNFLTAARLYNNGTAAISSTSALGAANPSAALSNARLRSAITAVDAEGVGSFSINGVAISYDVDTDSITSVLAKINSSNAGVSAAFDQASDRVVLTNKTTGDVGIAINEASGGLLGALGLTSGTTLTAGENAEFSVNGGETLYSTSNTLSDAVHGITGLSLTAASETTQSVTIAADTAAMRSKIETFITKFNAVQSYIDEQTKTTTTNGKVTAGVLSSNREVQSWATAFRSGAFSAVPGLTGTVSRLEQLGIDFTAGTSQLEIKNSAKLDAALTSHPNDVDAFFRTSATGFAARFSNLFNSFTGSDGNGGLLKGQKDNLLKANTSLDQQIADIDRRLVERRAQMETAFIAMEQAQAKLQQMQTQLTNAFFKDSK
ncbi:MAG TPA: flagellar filament capping protein FliD [Candidatus Synoicihabitans sp.]|nr:flagellar filament capping protein FliD [Candidatus Synoicihabitans sp.]